MTDADAFRGGEADATEAGGRAGPTREELLRQHRDVIRRRHSVPLGGPEYRQLAEEVARIEIEIARIDEPPVEGDAETS